MCVGSLSLWVYFLLLEALITEWTISATLIVFMLASSMLQLKKVVERSCKLGRLSVPSVCTSWGCFRLIVSGSVD